MTRPAVRVLLTVIGLVACRHDREAEPAPPLVVPAAVPVSVAVPPKPAVIARPAALARVTIKALGMYCEESCPMRVRYALAGLGQVYELGFDPANESIFVSYDATLGTPRDVTRPMLLAIKNAGFDPWLAREAWPDDARVQVVQR